MGTPDMLEFALRYARRGFYVIAVHTPHLDAAGNVVGCSCGMAVVRPHPAFRPELESSSDRNPEAREGAGG